MSAPVRFGDCELRRSERRLLVRGTPVPLGGRAFDVLSWLVEHRHRPVPKDELLDVVWPGQDVEEGNLAVHVSTLRKLLGPHAIATIPGQGYRFALNLDGDAPVAAPPAAAPAPESVAHTNLPALPTVLIGRDGEMAALDALLVTHPLVSVVGPGGIGKTRLAWAAARRRLDAGEGPLWWIDLSDLGDPAAVVSRIGAVLALPVERAPDPRQALLQGLRRQHARIVLDNCEHLSESIATLVAEALAEAPGVRWLATSQEPLRLAQEQVLRLDSLALPQPGMALPSALGCGALALLADRARAADRRFRIDEGNLPAVIDICRRLDGIPLALEMAAARLPWMGVDSVRQRLDERLRLLSSMRRDVAARQRTLQAALEWSHGLLDENERTMFRRLAVFRGGFTLEAARRVAGGHLSTSGDALADWAAIDTLGALVDKSLVQVAGPGSTAPMRYRMLESTRLFALAQLRSAGELEACQREHAAAMVDLALVWNESAWAARDADWVADVEPELDNLHAALQSAIDRRDVEAVAPLSEVCNFWATLTTCGAGLRRWAEPIEALLPGLPPTRAVPLLLQLGTTYRNIAPAKALVLFERALAACVEASPADAARPGDAGGESSLAMPFGPRLHFRLRASLAICDSRMGRQAQAEAHLTEARRHLQAGWPARLHLMECDASGFVAHFGGRSSEAEQHFRRFLDLALRAGIEGGVINVSNNLADMALAAGRIDEAVKIGRELVATLRRQRNNYSLGFALGNLFAALVALGDMRSAAAAGVEALGRLREEGNAVWLFDHFASLALRLGDARAASHCIGHGDAMRALTGLSRDPTEQRTVATVRAHLEQALPPEQWQAWLTEGAAMSAPAIDDLALALARQSAAQP